MPEKNCTSCPEVRSLAEFNRDKNTKDGLRSECKACQKIRRDEYDHTREGVVTRIYSHQRSWSRKRGHANPSYSKKQLSEWLISQDNFEELYLSWVASNYDKLLKPSCDRLNDYKGYSFDNLQLVTWQANLAKGHTDRKNGVNNKHSKAVIQLDKNRKWLAEHHSGRQASRDTGIDQADISKCCKRNQKTAGGFKWCFA